MHAMIIAANEEEREFLSWAVRQTGLTIHRGTDIDKIQSFLLDTPVDIIVIAVEYLTEMDEAIKALRLVSQAPIVIIADWASDKEHCALLDAGGDLVIKRPFSHRILMRYVRVFLRRTGAFPVSMLAPVEMESIRLEPSTRTLKIAQKEDQHLTSLEFRLLYMLMTNNGHIIPTDVIVERVWGYDGEANKELVRGLVRRLRLKVEPDPNNPNFIHNIPGIGYKFSPLQSEGSGEEE